MYVVCMCWLPVKLVLPTSSLSRPMVVLQLSPQSAVCHLGPRYAAVPRHFFQGWTHGGPGRPSNMTPIFANPGEKHIIAIGTATCSCENNLSTTGHNIGSIICTRGSIFRPRVQACRLRLKYTIEAFQSNESKFLQLQ